MKKLILLSAFLLNFVSLTYCNAKVEIGIDLFFKDGHIDELKNKKIGLITNHTGVNRELRSTIDLLKETPELTLSAIFSPEHGLNGLARASESISNSLNDDGIRIFSLHGKTRRPTADMLKDIDVLIYDIQEIGCRSYTYATTLFYAMEEAAKKNIAVIVLDRPNPINGLIVDGPMLCSNWRSFVGYINVPYCHGMTIGELACFFNEEYNIGCKLKVIPMKGWERRMSYKDTDLVWIPPSPNIPEPDSPFFYASTGILGTLSTVNIGIGYTLPFKIIGAPWIDSKNLVKQLNKQRLPGVQFVPFYYRPFYGAYKDKDCQGVKIIITDPLKYRPLAVQYLLIGILKTLYPKEMSSKLDQISSQQKKSFCQAVGNDEMLNFILKEKYVVWKLMQFQEQERVTFLKKRQKYLLY